MPVPDTHHGLKGLMAACLGAYGVFPERLNQEERSFAELLDGDESGTFKWWLRTPENERWATQLILPVGKRFFPDFVVGVAGRSTPNGIALVEIKDDGETGRLQSDRNLGQSASSTASTATSHGPSGLMVSGLGPLRARLAPHHRGRSILA